MEHSEASNQVISLGKLIVDELGLQNCVDTLSRWLAHYLAEQILRAEQLEGVEKKEAEKECFETILKLWERRWSLPRHAQPFGNFEQLFHLLERLNPDNESAFFYNDSHFGDYGRKVEVQREDGNEIAKWINIAYKIDHVARIWLDSVLTQAAKSASTPALKNWLENSVTLSHGYDRDIIASLVQINFDESPETLNDARKIKREDIIARVKKRISELEQFSKFNEGLIKLYNSELPRE